MQEGSCTWRISVNPFSTKISRTPAKFRMRSPSCTSTANVCTIFQSAAVIPFMTSNSAPSTSTFKMSILSIPSSFSTSDNLRILHSTSSAFGLKNIWWHYQRGCKHVSIRNQKRNGRDQFRWFFLGRGGKEEKKEERVVQCSPRVYTHSR